jgi:hypothetical protein
VKNSKNNVLNMVALKFGDLRLRTLFLLFFAPVPSGGGWTQTLSLGMMWQLEKILLI